MDGSTLAETLRNVSVRLCDSARPRIPSSESVVPSRRVYDLANGWGD
jgi:hypothetical protein